ncbi:MAG: hypothetical protein DLM62_14550 [Pseudonocardiales bacterium]|nr:MAG: hypothetical protein DLM62_14550 [Pseudonocardiales bacterium]
MPDPGKSIGFFTALETKLRDVILRGIDRGARVGALADHALVEAVQRTTVEPKHVGCPAVPELNSRAVPLR